MPKQIPKAENLHRGFVDLTMYYQGRFEVAIPPLNSPIILYRHIKRLAIPSMYILAYLPLFIFNLAHWILVDVYETIKTLQGILGFKFEFPSKDDRAKPRRALRQPEMQLAVLLVISTKLLFPFDDIKRYPATHGEPATQIMDWPEWLRAQRRFEFHPVANGKLGKEIAIQLTEKEVSYMEPQEMDQYMDWYESSWLDKPKALNPVADMFPTSRAEPASQSGPEMQVDTTTNDPGEALKALLQAVMGDLKPAPVSSSQTADVVRPGSWYRRYHWESELPEAAHELFKIVAELAAVPMSILIRTVANVEWRIAKRLEDQRRAEYIELWNTDGEEDDDDDEIGDEVDELDQQLYNLGVGEGLSG